MQKGAPSLRSESHEEGNRLGVDLIRLGARASARRKVICADGNWCVAIPAPSSHTQSFHS